ncbi:MAG: hypothetical protein GEU78_00710 [Actinobacteria bacterium]|nr:hypothetical protein [Actinomycetota bacterium]
MSDLDAYDDEMARIWRPSEEDVERVLAGGSARDENLDGLPALLRDAQAHFGRPAAASKRAQDLAILALEASHLRDGAQAPSDVRTPRSWREILDRTRSMALRGAAVVVAASLSMIGLAYAGVDLPGQAAEAALEKVTGLELPNQAGGEVEVTQGDKSVADDVKAVIESTDERGCEFGQAVAEVASQNAQGDTGPEEDPCARAGSAEGDEATGEDESAAGRTTAAEVSAGGGTTGKEKAAEARSNGAAPADTSDDDGDDGAGTASDSSGGTSDEGTGRKP